MDKDIDRQRENMKTNGYQVYEKILNITNDQAKKNLKQKGTSISHLPLWKFLKICIYVCV